MGDALDTLFSDVKDTIGPAKVASKMGTSVKTVYKWLVEGKVPGYQIGSTWFIITAELKESIRATRNTRA